MNANPAGEYWKPPVRRDIMGVKIHAAAVLQLFRRALPRYQEGKLYEKTKNV